MSVTLYSKCCDATIGFRKFTQLVFRVVICPHLYYMISM